MVATKWIFPRGFFGGIERVAKVPESDKPECSVATRVQLHAL